MTLGARTGSHGSLHAAPPALRRCCKALTLARIHRLCLNRELGMLCLLLVSLSVLLAQVLPLTKDEDAPEVLWTDLFSSDLVQNTESLQHLSPSTIGTHQPRATFKMEKVLPVPQPTNYENETQPSVSIIPLSTIPLQYPCGNFSIPSSPADKKRTGPRPCPVCYVPVEQAIALMPTSPSVSPSLKNLTYVTEKNVNLTNLDVTEVDRGSTFGGYPSLEQRNDSFNIKDLMMVHCGFVKGKTPGRGTGFDIDDPDLLEMEQCSGVVVASAIFGNYDIVQQPKNISEAAKRDVCFYMFVDEETEAYIKNSTGLHDVKRVGLWRMVVVRNLPYADARRNGKVPKLLLHRLFPNTRFSLWIDGKLELVVDPYQILERFLWRDKATLAISKHYKRFDVFEEAEANKAAGKYDNTSIDYQIEFYKREGLTHYSESKLPITSDVPEGCVIIREHIPITNLFTCLWFNEIDRFTSRDQLSFSIVRDKIISKVNWSINMFQDCERRNFVIQAYHRDLLEQRNSLSSESYPPPAVTNELPRKVLPDTVSDKSLRSLARKLPPLRHGRDRRSGLRHRHSRSGIGRGIDSK